jgi:DNA repair ATPase RecN
MFTAGFQSFAFQTVGYGGVVVPPFLPNGGAIRRDYVPTYYEIENHKRKLEALRDSEREAEAQRLNIQYKIEALELKRLRDLADEAMQRELIALMREQYILDEILKDLQLKKAAWEREQDDILILLMSLPFYT